MPIITLTTDFGLQDAYVAAMKGAMLSINPNATIVDVCHSIEPQNIAQAAFLLGTVFASFPKDTIHVVIVDPEVGSRRRPIILKTPEALFVAPDNGVLSYVIQHHASPSRSFPEVELFGLPPGLLAVEIVNARFWRHPVSTTFHGRDIFAPVAAHLSLGVPLQEFGQVITSLNVLPIPQPQPGAGGQLTGHVLHIDSFGNVITDIRQEDLPPGRFRLQIAGQSIDSLSSSYANAQVDQLLALIGSSGHLEVAVRNGSAAALLGIKIGDQVTIKKD